MKKKLLCGLIIGTMAMVLMGCDLEFEESVKSEEKTYTSDLMTQAVNEVGNPNITNFYEKKMAKMIYEKRDDSELICYVYNQNLEGQYVYIGQSLGYGLPYSTQYTSPIIEEYKGSTSSYTTVATYLAEPNGLYTPDGLSATWLLMIDDNGNTYIMYCEPTIVVQEQKMDRRLVAEWSLEGIDY